MKSNIHKTATETKSPRRRCSQRLMQAITSMPFDTLQKIGIAYALENFDWDAESVARAIGTEGVRRINELLQRR